jgi:hypothetical protein
VDVRASRENMKTRIRTASLAFAVLVIGLSAATAGCGKYSIRNLKAMKAFKEANDHYRGQRWREAADRRRTGRHEPVPLHRGVPEIGHHAP